MKNELIQKIWEIKAVSVNTKEQFTLVSGAKSPIYIDCRKLISYPEIMDMVADEAQKVIEKIGNIDVLAGGVTAGIPFTTWISVKTGIPMIYVRKEAKGYGKSAQIEGNLEEGKQVLLVEDLITDGKSKLVFIEGIKNAGAAVENCLVFFDREQGGSETLSEQGVKMHALVTLSETLEFGLKNNLISQEDFDIVKEYLKK